MQGHKIAVMLVMIDACVEKILNAILHHPQFQRLESRYRGVCALLDTLNTAGNPDDAVKLKILNVNWMEIDKDFACASDYEQSQLFCKIYSQEFDQPGGEPFGLLLLDEWVFHDSSRIDVDLNILATLAKIAAAAFAPILLSISPRFFAAKAGFCLNGYVDWDDILQFKADLSWKCLRRNPEFRFLGLFYSAFLMRAVYAGDKKIDFPFVFEEKIDKTQHYLWGNSIYRLGEAVICGFHESGWFMPLGEGSEQQLLSQDFSAKMRCYFRKNSTIDRALVFNRPPVKIWLARVARKWLKEQGIEALNALENGGVFHSNECFTVYQNFGLSVKLSHILCVSRFVHAIKAIARNQLGPVVSASACEQKLQNWLTHFISATTQVSGDLRIKYPLKDARAQVREKWGDPRIQICSIQMVLHEEGSLGETPLQFVTEFAQ